MCSFETRRITPTTIMFSSHDNSFLHNDAPLFKAEAFNVALFDVTLFDVALFIVALFQAALYFYYCI